MEFTQGHEKYAEKCVVMALSLTRPCGLLWRSLGAIREQVASFERQSGAAAPNL